MLRTDDGPLPQKADDTDHQEPRGHSLQCLHNEERGVRLSPRQVVGGEYDGYGADAGRNRQHAAPQGRSATESHSDAMARGECFVIESVPRIGVRKAAGYPAPLRRVEWPRILRSSRVRGGWRYRRRW